MIVEPNERIVCVDVDDTLVIWNVPRGREQDCVLFDNFGFPEWLLPHDEHIKMLKRFKARGIKVIVWSQAGPQWVESVVKTLNLEKWVDLIMAKPRWVIDDLPPRAWTERVFLELDGKPSSEEDVSVIDWEEIDGDKRPEYD